MNYNGANSDPPVRADCRSPCPRSFTFCMNLCIMQAALCVCTSLAVRKDRDWAGAVERLSRV